MKLSREKIVHLSHLILSHLNHDEEVEFFAEPQEIRQQIFHIIGEEMKSDEAIDAIVRRKLEQKALQDTVDSDLPTSPPPEPPPSLAKSAEGIRKPAAASTA